ARRLWVRSPTPRQNRLLRGAQQPLATTAGRRLVRLLLRPSAEKEFVDFDRAAERVLARQHQAQGMPNAPRRRLAYPERLGQANGGQPLVRLQDQPQRFEPGAQRQFGGVQWRARRRRELETASAIGALVQTRPCPVLAHVAPRQRDRTLVATRRTNPSVGPHQGFHQSSAPLLVAERLD